MSRTITLLLFLPFVVLAAPVKQGDTLRIVTPDVTARLCPTPNCGQNQHIARIPEGTELEVAGVRTVKSGILETTWVEVTYNGKRGWVSIYDTDKQ